MTIRHKIKLIFCRIRWWFKTLDEAREFVQYKRVKRLYDDRARELLTEEKKNIESSRVKQLRIEVNLLSELL